ncbi:Two-component system protein B-like protein [Emericellopsis cladophorae]|uniref:histidine kinase n=1 Tax=Emericellopsis cladophorae TaxID=2686198 RepID=A0A9P9Y213_9HYPO|nr:Two-component system protein B-like protein [Emericellopsis cladophorae]KAI6782079.1 Two-component system protein B-like protein [Emericellopsis cladophorae]
MRIAIREQLALLVLLAVLAALAVVSIPTWIYVNGHIATNLKDGLTLTASLKAARITSQIELIRTACYTIASRLLLQEALQRYYQENEFDFYQAKIDITSALAVGSSTGLLQARIYSRNGTDPQILVNATASNPRTVQLPYSASNGDPVFLGDTDNGYPPSLYPNITYVDLGRPNRRRPAERAVAAEAFPGVRIYQDDGLLLGPLMLNETFALMSLSVPIRDNSDDFILGYMTVIAEGHSLIHARDSPEGLGNTGLALILGPTTPWNRFPLKLPPASNSSYQPDQQEFGDLMMHFVLPPNQNKYGLGRHKEHVFDAGTAGDDFLVESYPAAVRAWTEHNPSVNNASAMLKTHNEQNVGVSVGYALTQTPLVNWTVIVELSQDEAYQPIHTLRNILLGTVFGTAGFLALLVFPCAHFSVMPIRKLKAATERSINPPGYDDACSDTSDYEAESPNGGSGNLSHRSKKGFMTTISRLMRGQTTRVAGDRDAARRMFKIPGKVDEGKHVVTDELTELTRTFNDMSDELVKQYVSLDEKVAERTRQLSESKKAAEAANESKTLFIANISHELKTPLNAILGLCAVSMEEEDMLKIRHSLKVVYESGDLLLHLLEDLLSFSKNQIGHQIVMEPKEFQLADIRSQIVTIFDKQVREGSIDFAVNFRGSADMPDPDDSEVDVAVGINPFKTQKLESLWLWGDQHRILQVLINLVSNSLKFTPANGKVEVRIRCLGEELQKDTHSRGSSRSNSRSGARKRVSGSVQSVSSGGHGSTSSAAGHTALAINPMEPRTTPAMQVADSIHSLPFQNAKAYIFEFEVQDTGPGIPQSLQDRVFEPFVQGDPGLSKKYGGTGLGLSICHQLAVLMGGNITLKSTEGVGSTFTMHIPLKHARTRTASSASSAHKSNVEHVEAEPPCPPGVTNGTRASSPDAADEKPSPLHSQPRLVGLRQPYFSSSVESHGGNKIVNPIAAAKTGKVMPSLIRSPSGRKLRVLVADDNKTNIEVVSRMLNLEDVSDVTIAKDGQEAFDLVKGTMEKNQPFDVIFMDVQMPNVDGLQSTRLIRGMGYKSPIVALTAFSEESNMKDCIASGMDEFLSKPIRRPALKQVLKRFATIPEEPEHPSPQDEIDEKTALRGSEQPPPTTA